MLRNKRLLLMALVHFLIAGACAVNTRPMNTLPSPTSIMSGSAQTIPTLVTAPTVTKIPSITEFFHTDEYILESTTELGVPGSYYIVQDWDNSTSDSAADHRVSIKGAFETIWIDFAELGQLPKEDITGEGDPDIIVYGRGARLWNPVYIYSLGDERNRIFSDYIPREGTREGDCHFEIMDLNDDGIPEIINCDSAFGHFDCGPSWGPMPLLIYEYDSISNKYQVVNPLYPDLYRNSIERSTKAAEIAPSSKCAAATLVMDYLYSGQTDKGWSEFYRVYQGNDIEILRNEIEEILMGKQQAGRFVLLDDLKKR